MSAPAGWYPDPSDRSRQRWWDGAQWTAHEQVVGSGYVAAPAYAPPAKVHVETNTVWVWLAIAASVVPFLTLFLMDWNGYIDGIVAASSGYGGGAQLLQWELHTLAISSIAWIALVAFIVFSWLDWRELRQRGVPAPFHWAWSFFALLNAGLAVYMIGRAVVLIRRTERGGWPPLWVWIGATVIGYIVAILWMFQVLGETFSRLGGLYLGT